MDGGSGGKTGASADVSALHTADGSISSNPTTASLTSPVNGGPFDYPPTLKSRGSPRSGRQRQRSPTGSVSAGPGQQAIGAGGALAGMFIGGAFGRISSGKPSLTGRRATNAGLALPLPRLRGTRLSKLLIISTAAAILWWVLVRSRDAGPRPRLTTRWWEDGTAEDLAVLLPKPPMPMKPPKPKPPAVISHTKNQLGRLASSFSSSSPPDWTAVIHLTSAAQFPMLATLVPSALRQSIPPHAIIVLAPEGITPSISSHGPIVSLASYPTSKPPILALISTSSATLTTDYMLLIDASLDALPFSYAKELLRAAGTKEYAAAVLSSGGLILPTLALAPPATCVPRKAPGDQAAAHGLDQTVPIHVPSTPSLMQSTWLPLVTHGLRTDIPLEAALALALWTKSGIPAYALPVSSESSSPSDHDFGCERLKRALQTRERSLGQFWSDEIGPAGGGLRARRKAAASLAAKSEDELRRAGWPRADGAVVVLVSGREELEVVRPLACGLSERPDLDVRIYLADRGDVSSADVLDGGYVPDKGAEEGSTQRCHLDLRPLGTGAAAESVSILLVDEFDKLDRVEVAIYASDGARAREFDEVLKWQGGVFAPGRGGGGERRTRAQAEGKSAQGATTVISLSKSEIAFTDWLSALPLSAMRHWHTPRIDLSVVTNNRPRSLFRLLNSLQDAMYYGDDVSLLLNLEQTADSTTQKVVDKILWPHGTINVRHRIILGGLMPSIVESWYPASNDSYGVFLEDDVEVSPYFYGWLKFSILQYRYGTLELRAQAERMFGVSLYQPRNVELRPEGRQPFDAHKLFQSMSLDSTTPYLSQVPCSWGAAYFPEVWREFHSYLSLRLSEVALPISDTIVPDIKSNRWPRSWKKYFIELVYMRGYVMLYPNYPDFGSLSTNHVEKGTHIKSDADLAKRQRLFEVPLLSRSATLLDLPAGRLPEWDTLPVLDLWGSLATSDALMERGWQTLAQLDTCPSGPPRLDRPVSYNARELLCKREYVPVDRLVTAQPLQPATGLGLAAVRAAQAAAAAAAAAQEASDDEQPVADRPRRLWQQGAPQVRQKPIARPDLVNEPDVQLGAGRGGHAVVGAAEYRRAADVAVPFRAQDAAQADEVDEELVESPEVQGQDGEWEQADTIEEDPTGDEDDNEDVEDGADDAGEAAVVRGGLREKRWKVELGGENHEGESA